MDAILNSKHIDNRHLGDASARREDAAAATERDPRWASVLARDPNADGSFYYSVKTTGVYCRPSCASRRARAQNIRFHASGEEAERAGFRACKRCRPDQPGLHAQHAVKVAQACRLIETSEQVPSLAVLATQAELSPWHFHRIFKAITGLTPKAYANANRAQRVRKALAHSDSVTAAAYDAGYSSSARFYAQSSEVLGMTPRSYRAGGADTVIRFAVGECTLGSILVAASDRGLCAILIGDEPDALARELQDQFQNAELVGGDADFEKRVAEVVGFVDAPRIGLTLPLDVRGTAFQQRVWNALREIPAGATASYSEIARRIGAPKSARAVAQACRVIAGESNASVRCSTVRPGRECASCPRLNPGRECSRRRWICSLRMRLSCATNCWRQAHGGCAVTHWNGCRSCWRRSNRSPRQRRSATCRRREACACRWR